MVMPNLCALGHALPDDAVRCPECGLGRIPTAPQTPAPPTPHLVAPPTATEPDASDPGEYPQSPEATDGSAVGLAPGWYPRSGTQQYWTGTTWVAPPSPLKGNDVAPTPQTTAPAAPQPAGGRRRGPTWRRNTLLALIAGLAVMVTAIIAWPHASDDSGPEGQEALAGAPSNSDLALAVDAFQQQGVESQVSLEANYVVITLTPIRATASAADVVAAASKVAWRAVPGNYLGVCVEASNMQRGCKDAGALRGLYGEPGGGS
jgi:hypothetical protein